MAKAYLLNEDLLGKVRQVVERVEGTPIGNGRTKIETRFDDPGQQPQSKTFRICTFTGSWSINASKTVTFRGVTSTPNTVSAINLVCGLNPGTVTCDVSVAKDGTAWYLVQPNLTQQPGYSGSGTQVLTIQNGSLAWVGTTACS